MHLNFDTSDTMEKVFSGLGMANKSIFLLNTDLVNDDESKAV